MSIATTLLVQVQSRQYQKNLCKNPNPNPNRKSKIKRCKWYFRNGPSDNFIIVAAFKLLKPFKLSEETACRASICDIAFIQVRKRDVLLFDWETSKLKSCEGGVASNT